MSRDQPVMVDQGTDPHVRLDLLIRGIVVQEITRIRNAEGWPTPQIPPPFHRWARDVQGGEPQGATPAPPAPDQPRQPEGDQEASPAGTTPEQPDSPDPVQSEQEDEPQEAQEAAGAPADKTPPRARPRPVDGRWPEEPHGTGPRDKRTEGQPTKSQTTVAQTPREKRPRPNPTPHVRDPEERAGSPAEQHRTGVFVQGWRTPVERTERPRSCRPPRRGDPN